jgi:hypothetical protein
MAIETPCQTPGAQFHTVITADRVSVVIDLPAPLDLTEADARQLEADLHNATELVLARWWPAVSA